MIVIKIEQEFKDLIVDGQIDVRDDLVIVCDITSDTGMQAKGLNHVHGTLVTSGDFLIAGGLVVSNILAQGNFLIQGWQGLLVYGDISVKKNKKWDQFAVKGDMRVGGDCYIENLWWWNSLDRPQIEGHVIHKEVLPTNLRNWADRLGIDIGEGSYNTTQPDGTVWEVPDLHGVEGGHYVLIQKIKEKLPELLVQDKWSKTERWMLESLK